MMIMRAIAKVTIALFVGIMSSSAVAQSQSTDRQDVDGSLPSSSVSEVGEADSDIELLEMEIPIVVTATRREQRIIQVPYAISIVTQEDIRRSGAQTIPDALRLVPGVDVADLTSGVSTVSPRATMGLINRQVLVLVDGRQIFDALFGGSLWGSWPFQLEDIDRIELIRGPGGVTWGANAVNGVINIITKDPSDQQGVVVTAGGGNRGFFKSHVGYGMVESDLSLRVSAEYEADDGFRRGGSIFGGLDDDRKVGRFGFHSVYSANERDSYTFSAGTAVVDGMYPPTPLSGLGAYRNSGSQASFITGKWTRVVNDDEIVELQGYVNDFGFSPGMQAIDYRYQQFALLFSHSFKPADDHLLTWGIDGRVDILDTSNSNPFASTKDFMTTTTVGVYVQDEWRFAPRWSLGLGGRIDYEAYGGFEPSARASLLYELSDDSVVYGAVSQAFQMAPVGIRFADIPVLNGIGRIKGDRDFDAVTVMAYELGYRAHWLGKIDATANLFWHEYTDFSTLSPQLAPPGLVRFDIDNRAALSVYGVELDLRYRVSEDLTLLGNYTYERMNWRSSVPYHDVDGSTPPKHKFMLGARYDLTQDIHLNSHLYFVDEVEAPNETIPFASRDIDAYLRLDLNAEYEFWDDRASIRVGVRNLLDGDHNECSTVFLNNAEVPRTYFAELRVELR